MMALYSLAMLAGLLLAAPWWLFRMATTQRYREGLAQRCGRVPSALAGWATGKRIVWLHAVSVGEVLAASRLIAELEAGLNAALGPGWQIAISTTTRTGQALARERFGPHRVFYMPLDFAFAVRPWLRVLRPVALVLMESEVWPRLLHECHRAAVPVAVVNARISDRSFARALRLKLIWAPVLRRIHLWLAQSPADARRLLVLGAAPSSVQVTGNLKFDVRAPRHSSAADRIRQLAAGRPVVVAGSTVGVDAVDEEALVLQAWKSTHSLLVLAPRHPERFALAAALLRGLRVQAASSWQLHQPPSGPAPDVILLDTIGDLAAVYSVADIAFVGGSLVPRGGHNPLEAAQFGVPVLMGPHFENFRTVVQAMHTADGLRLVADNVALESALVELLADLPAARSLGQRGQLVFEQQQGATRSTVTALVHLIRSQQ